MPDPLILATAFNQITPDARKNGAQIRELMRAAKAEGARLIHFPEGALSGYAKSEILDWRDVDWGLLRSELEAVAAHAAEIGLWVVVGCNHRLAWPKRPYNCLYVISSQGELVGRYDKRICSNTEATDWYAAGAERFVFEIDGYRFGTALCIELHFPELFMDYGGLGVDCVLFSAYSRDPTYGILARAHAAMNNFWFSVSTPAQCSVGLASSLIGPDGYYISKGSNDGSAGLTIGKIDRDDPRFEIALTKARPWRAKARRDWSSRDPGNSSRANVASFFEL
jgi:deaminated glutathione amidase